MDNYKKMKTFFYLILEVLEVFLLGNIIGPN